MTIDVRNVDCREGLKTLPDRSVQLILTDPPYGIDGMGETWDSTQLKARTQNSSSRTSSVGGLPTSQIFSKEQGVELYKFLLPVFEECFRVLVPGGILIAFASPRLYHRATTAADDVGFEIRDQGMWVHNGGQGKAARQRHRIRKMKGVSRDEKRAMLYSIGNRTTVQLRPMYEPFMIAQKPCEGRLTDNWMKYKAGLINPHQSQGQQTTIFTVPKPQKRHGHLTTKPVKLMKDLIRVFASPNSKILDPFMGSGSTGVAAILQHDFIGFEINPQHFSAAQRRINFTVREKQRKQRAAWKEPAVMDATA